MLVPVDVSLIRCVGAMPYTARLAGTVTQYVNVHDKKSTTHCLHHIAFQRPFNQHDLSNIFDYWLKETVLCIGCGYSREIRFS